MFFYQYVQSFSPDENITPEKAHEVGVELANYFKDHEVLIATHLDADHLHNHFIINSVSHATGMKLQEGPDSLLKMRKLSDEICLQHGLTVLKPYTYEKDKVKGMNTREYRSAIKGDSWKFKLINSIDQAMKTSHSKEDFIDSMAAYGYQTNWTNNRKYITYVTPDGKKCRDNKLHEEKYLKERMEGYFLENGFTAIKRTEPTGGIDPSGGNNAQTLHSNGLRHTAGTMGSEYNASVGNGEIQFGDTELHDEPADTGIYRGRSQSSVARNGAKSEEGDSRQRLQDETGDRNGTIGYNEGINTDNEGNAIRNVGNLPHSATKSQSKRFVADKSEIEMDGDRRNHNDSVMDAADALQSFIKPKKTNKNDKEFENNERSKQQRIEEYEQHHQYGYEQEIDSDIEEEFEQEWDLEM